MYIRKTDVGFIRDEINYVIDYILDNCGDETEFDEVYRMISHIHYQCLDILDGKHLI